MQENVHQLEHPNCYFLWNFNNAQRNYSTSEKEVLGLILALQQFEFYITPAQFPIDIFTDYNPMVFLNPLLATITIWAFHGKIYVAMLQHKAGGTAQAAQALAWALFMHP